MLAQCKTLACLVALKADTLEGIVGKKYSILDIMSVVEKHWTIVLVLYSCVMCCVSCKGTILIDMF